MKSSHDAASADGSWLSIASAAALALGFGVAADTHATTAPVDGEFGWRSIVYKDWQSGSPRIAVRGYAVNAFVPISDRWALEAYTVVDAISGASPLYYTAAQSLTPLVDKRRAWDMRSSHYFRGSRLTVGLAESHESDYISRSALLLYSASSDNQNTTWTAGTSATADKISPVNQRVVDAHKDVGEVLLGVTKVFSPHDLVQVQITHANGNGYFTDPYKLFDVRPDTKRQSTVLLRWNHRFVPILATLRTTARLYRDSFGVRSATLGADWAQEAAGSWVITPSVRLYAQTPASFFSPPDPAQPDRPNLPIGYRFGRSLISMDQRLAGYGALTLGVKLEKRLDGHGSLYFKVEHYKQSTGWGWMGGGGAVLRDFHARTLQVGYTYRWTR